MLTRLEQAVWAEWNALAEDHPTPVKEIARRLGMGPADVAFIVYPGRGLRPVGWRPGGRSSNRNLMTVVSTEHKGRIGIDDRQTRTRERSKPGSTPGRSTRRRRS